MRSQKCAQRMVEECITGVNIDLREYIELDSDEIMRIYEREILGNIADRNEKDPSMIYGNILNYCITEENSQARNANANENGARNENETNNSEANSTNASQASTGAGNANSNSQQNNRQQNDS